MHDRGAQGALYNEAKMELHAAARNGLHSSINQRGNISHFKKQNVAIMQAREIEAALATTTYSGTVEHTG